MIRCRASPKIGIQVPNRVSREGFHQHRVNHGVNNEGLYHRHDCGSATNNHGGMSQNNEISCGGIHRHVMAHLMGE